MNNKNIILMFLDLEGTILNETTGDFEADEIMCFFKEIDNLQKISKSEVYLYIVSPMKIENVEKILDKLDTFIVRYSVKNNTKLKQIQGATAVIREDLINPDYPYDRITPFKTPINKSELDVGKVGKLMYVKSWINEYNSRTNIKLPLCIYCGNGRNDIDAMNYVKSLKNGIILCPKNSRTKIREIANFMGSSTDIVGITEALHEVNDYINRNKLGAINNDKQR